VTTTHASTIDALTKSKVATAASKLFFSFIEVYFGVKNLISLFFWRNYCCFHNISERPRAKPGQSVTLSLPLIPNKILTFNDGESTFVALAD